MPECEKCGCIFKTTKYLSKHQKSAQYCSKYKDILFVCRKCNFNIKGIHNIEQHNIECDGTYIQPLETKLLETKLLESEDKVKLLEINIKNKELSLLDIQLRLQFEQMKNKIYINVIQTQTDIKVENIIQENNNEIHVFNFENGKIPVVVHEFATQHTEKYTIELPKTIVKKPRKKIKRSSKNTKIEDHLLVIEPDNICEESEEKEKPKKIVYRSVKEYETTTEQVMKNKLNENIVRVDEELNKIVYDNFDVSHKNISEELESLLDSISTSRKYTVSLTSIKRIRKKLLGKLTLNEYILLLNDHIKRIEKILLDKNYTQNKIKKTVAKSLTPLDMRLTHYHGYTNSNIEHDDIQQFGLALEVLVEHKKQFIPYNKNTFIDNIKNYSLSLFELKDCIERCLVNRYKFHNVIYIHRSNSTNKDPFSFYTLASVGDRRCWRMECRLDDFSQYFSDVISTYCITLFRKLYKDVFNDNIYRQDYIGKSQITEFDCEQLLHNIILLAQPITLCKLFQDIIKEKCTLTSTESDKFDLYGDDKLQQKKFASTKDTNEDTCQIMKRLFDGISEDDALDIVNSH